jgi:Zn-dependent oligopeptidase
VYLAGASGPTANLALLDHILSTRHQLAHLLGFDSYAAFKAADGSVAGWLVGLVWRPKGL